MERRSMNILVADDLEIYRLGMKLYLKQIWPLAYIGEAESLHEVINQVFDVFYDLLILDIDMPGTELLEDFIVQAIKYTKVVLFSSFDINEERVVNLMSIGTHVFIPKTASKEEVINSLYLLFKEA
ncbi:MAG: response regulator transcription factor [Pedobacter sp.]|nr:MAG: response regulator transcription factor [Pedobacter sp.]